MDTRTFTENTRARLIRKRGKYRQVAELSGVSYSWIQKFAGGKENNPSVETIDAVFYALNKIDGTEHEAA